MTTYNEFITKMCNLDAAEIACIASHMLECLNSSKGVMESIQKMSKGPASVVAHVLRPMSGDFDERARHMVRTCKEALNAAHVIDFEGINTGKYFSPADVVKRHKGVTTLIDYTSDKSLAEAKLVSLKTKTEALKVVWPEETFKCKVIVFKTKVQRKPYEVEEYDSTQDSDFFKAMADLAEEVNRKDIDPSVFINYISTIITDRLADTVTMEEKVRMCCKRVMAGTQAKGDIETVARAARGRYPKLRDVALTIGTNVWSDARGMPPPAKDAPKLTIDSPSWAGLLAAAYDCEVDKYISWSEGSPVVVSDEQVIGSVMMRKVHHPYVTFKLMASAPDEWHDLVKRNVDNSPRHEDQIMTESELDEDYAVSEELLRVMSTTCDSSVESMYDKGRLAAEAGEGHDAAHSAAIGMASKLIKGVNNTLGGQIHATASALFSGAPLAFRAKSSLGFRLVKHGEGRIISLVKKTGDLARDSDTSLLAAVSMPVGPRLAWESARIGDEISLSKAIFSSGAMRRNCDHAFGAVIGLASAYADASRCMQTGIESAGVMAACSVVGNKAWGVALSAERALATGSSAVYNKVDEVAKKIASVKPTKRLEMQVLRRVAMRCMACALLRDQASLEDVMTEASAEGKSPRYVPAFAHSGSFHYMGILNSVYDYVLASPEAPSKVRNECVALTGVFEDEVDFTSRMASDDITLWGMSRSTRRAWRRGELAQYVGTEEFMVAETEFLSVLSETALRHTVSITLMTSYAKKLRKDKGLEKDFEASCNLASSVQVTDFMVNKSAVEYSRLKTERCALPAYKTISGYVAHIGGSINEGFAPESISSFIRGDYGLRSRFLCVYACTAFFCLHDWVVASLAKDFTVEKSRDIFMMVSFMRMMQSFMEKVSQNMGRMLEWSALQEGSKADVLNKMGRSAPVRGMIDLWTQVDKQRYGPSRVLAALYGVLIGLGATGTCAVLFRATLSRTQRKKVRPGDRVMNATEASISEANSSVAPGVASIINNARRSVNSALPVSTGSGQGLTQNTSDLATAVGAAILEEVMCKVVGRTVVRITNDDGAMRTEVPASDIFAVGPKICEVLKVVGFCTAENTNESKVIISTWDANLNTQSVPTGDAVGMDRVALPWARTLTATTGASDTADLRTQALNAMSCTNGGVDEGAPLFALCAALAMSYGAFYHRFRFTSQVQNKVFAGGTPDRLGPPIFAPFHVRNYGPALVVAAWQVRNLNTTSDQAVNSLVAYSLSEDTPDAGSMDWSQTYASKVSDPAITRYIVTSLPTAKILGDDELAEVIAECATPDSYQAHASLSVSKAMVDRFLDLRRDARTRSSKPVSVSVYNASVAFATKMTRIRAYRVTLKDGVATESKEDIDYATMIKELSVPLVPSKVQAAPPWGLTANLKIRLVELCDTLDAYRGAGGPKKTAQRKVLRSVGEYSGGAGSDSTDALAVGIASEGIRGAVALEVAKNGTLVNTRFKSVDAADPMRLRMVMNAARNLNEMTYPRGRGLVPVPLGADTSTLKAFTMMAPWMDIGLGIALDVPSTEFGMPPPSTVTSPTEDAMTQRLAGAVADEIKRQVLLEGVNTDNPTVCNEQVNDPVSATSAGSGLTPSAWVCISSSNFKATAISLGLARRKVHVASSTVSKMITMRSPTYNIRAGRGLVVRHDRSFQMKDSRGRQMACKVYCNRVDDEAYYNRRYVALVASIDSVKQVLSEADGSLIEWTADRLQKYRYKAVRKGKTLYLNLITGGHRANIRLEGYPTVVMAETANGRYPVCELDTDVDTSSLEFQGLTTPAVATKFPKQVIMGMFGQFSMYILQMHGMAEALASKAAGIGITGACLCLVDRLLDFEVDASKNMRMKIILCAAHDASKQGLTRHLAANLAAAVGSVGGANFDLAIMSSADGPEIGSFIKAKVLGSIEKAVEVQVPGTREAIAEDMHEKFEVDDLLKFLMEADDDEDEGEEDAAAMLRGEQPGHVVEDVERGLTSEDLKRAGIGGGTDEDRLIMEILGRPEDREMEIATQGGVTAMVANRYMIGRDRGPRRKTPHRQVFAAAEVACTLAAADAAVRTQTRNTSLALIGYIEMAAATSVPDEILFGMAVTENCTLFHIISASEYGAVSVGVRKRLCDNYEAEGKYSLNMRYGLEQNVELTLDGARDLGLIIRVPVSAARSGALLAVAGPVGRALIDYLSPFGMVSI
jgi:hypothetical protein